MEKIADASTTYDRFGLSRKNGWLRDRTFWQVPRSNWWESEWFSKGPRPVTELEAYVTFTNADLEPLKIPALLGSDKNDDGDYTLPYMRTTNTELDRFRQLSTAITWVVTTQAKNIVITSFEVKDDDGSLTEAGADDLPAMVFSGDEVLICETVVPHCLRTGDPVSLISSTHAGGDVNGVYIVGAVSQAEPTKFEINLFRPNPDSPGVYEDADGVEQEQPEFLWNRPFYGPAKADYQSLESWVVVDDPAVPSFKIVEPATPGTGIVEGEYTCLLYTSPSPRDS